ncbi:MAG: hypothetical protein H0U92_08305 [Actinobacteria bacterium]|nr:hypothetical protein [Actinomycetota bacterium]
MLANAMKPLRRAAALALVATALALSAPAAMAQSTGPYPGNPTTTTPQPTSAVIDLGLKPLGAKFTVSQCGFLPGTIVRFVVNNVVITPDVVVDTNGCVQETFEISPRLVALGRPAGLRLLAATGLAAPGTNVQVKVNGQAITVGPIGSVVTSVATGTGSNGASRTVQVKFTVVKPGTTDTSGLARTGTTILRWSPLGAGLVAIGYLLVLVTRRRRDAEAI